MRIKTLLFLFFVFIDSIKISIKIITRYFSVKNPIETIISQDYYRYASIYIFPKKKSFKLLFHKNKSNQTKSHRKVEWNWKTGKTVHVTQSFDSSQQPYNFHMHHTLFNIFLKIMTIYFSTFKKIIYFFYIKRKKKQKNNFDM